VVRLRETNEPAEVVAVLDAAGRLLVRVEGEEPFEVAREDVRAPGDCACCGD
jgi:hypothetical protein